MTQPTTPLLRVRDLKTYFVTERGRGTARAVDGVSFDLYAGETLGIPLAPKSRAGGRHCLDWEFAGDIRYLEQETGHTCHQT